jgi:drug/metabolite transporter (DMT)-like permease
LNVLIVPVIGLLAGKIPERRIIVAILLALAGLFALCWDGGAWSRGDNLALAGAVFFGLYVKWMEVSTRKSSDLMTLTAVQIVTVALCAGLWLLVLVLSASQFDWLRIEHGVRANIVNLLYLGVIATAAIISLQTWGQRHASANEAAVTYAFEPACAAGAAYFWLAETMAWRGIAGGVLLITGIIASQWHPRGQPAAALPDQNSG